MGNSFRPPGPMSTNSILKVGGGRRRSRRWGDGPDPPPVPRMCSRRFPRNVPVAFVDESEFNRCCAALGIGPGVTNEILERAYLKKNFALIRTGTPEEREQLRMAPRAAGRPPQGAASIPIRPSRGPAGRARQIPAAPAARCRCINPRRPIPGGNFAIRGSFDSWLVNLLALPSSRVSPGWSISARSFFFLKGFHVWMHEFGHATAAWLTGRRALPLPIGVDEHRAGEIHLRLLRRPVPARRAAGGGLEGAENLAGPDRPGGRAVAVPHDLADAGI